MTDRTAEWGARLQKVADREWATARAHAAVLLRGGSLPRTDSHNLTLAPGELAVLRTVVTVGGSSEWGEEHAAAVIATTDRLVISHRLRGWQSFWLTDLQHLEPDLASPAGWVLTLHWHDGHAVRLSGLGVPALAVQVGAMALPGRWMDLPPLQALLAGLVPAGRSDADEGRAGDLVTTARDQTALLDTVTAAMTALVESPGNPDWADDLRCHPDAAKILGRPEAAAEIIDATARRAGVTLAARWPGHAGAFRVGRDARIEMFLPQTPVVRPRVQDAARAVFNRGVTDPLAVQRHLELEDLRVDELWEVWSAVLRWFEISVEHCYLS